jgi:hypothetical protein
MMKGRVPRILVVGLAWGIIEAILILWIFPPGTPYKNVGLDPNGLSRLPGSPSPVPSLDRYLSSYFLTLAGVVLCIVTGLGLLVGYLMNEYYLVGRLLVSRS